MKTALKYTHMNYSSTDYNDVNSATVVLYVQSVPSDPLCTSSFSSLLHLLLFMFANHFCREAKELPVSKNVDSALSVRTTTTDGAPTGRPRLWRALWWERCSTCLLTEKPFLTSLFVKMIKNFALYSVISAPSRSQTGHYFCWIMWPRVYQASQNHCRSTSESDCKLVLHQKDSKNKNNTDKNIKTAVKSYIIAIIAIFSSF